LRRTLRIIDELAPDLKEFKVGHLQQCAYAIQVALAFFGESGAVVAQFFLNSGPRILQHRA
jgi:hypothetical protein